VRSKHGELVDRLTMLSVRDRDQRAGRRQSRVVQVVLDAEMDVEFDQQIVEILLALGDNRRSRRDLFSQPLEHLVVVLQHGVGVHLATPFPAGSECWPSPRNSIIPWLIRA
jgi:hypothetical protein